MRTQLKCWHFFSRAQSSKIKSNQNFYKLEICFQAYSKKTIAASATNFSVTRSSSTFGAQFLSIIVLKYVSSISAKLEVNLIKVRSNLCDSLSICFSLKNYSASRYYQRVQETHTPLKFLTKTKRSNTSYKTVSTTNDKIKNRKK